MFTGSGTEQDPYMIYNAAELAALAVYVNANTAPYANAGIYYKLGADIDLSEYGETWNNGQGWIPIGTSTTYSFKGNFDGNGKIIKDLYINTKIPYVGLFGFSNGIIKNVKIYKCNISNESSNSLYGNGSIVGGNTGRVENCWVIQGVLNHNIGTSSNTGGIVGFNSTTSGLITRCYFSGLISVLGGAQSIGGGGICGRSTVTSVINNCYSEGEIYVKQTNRASNNYWTMGGGIVAYLNNSTVSNCYSLCKITVVDNNANTGGGAAGAIVGYKNAGNVLNCVGLSEILYQTIVKSYGRILGASESSGSNTNNAGYIGMINPQGTTEWSPKGHNTINGEDITLEEIYADPTMGGRFLPQNGWIIEKGKLPSFDKTKYISQVYDKKTGKPIRFVKIKESFFH